MVLQNTKLKREFYKPVKIFSLRSVFLQHNVMSGPLELPCVVYKLKKRGHRSPVDPTETNVQSQVQTKYTESKTLVYDYHRVNFETNLNLMLHITYGKNHPVT